MTHSKEDALYVLIKRGLYWRPESQGYTGVLAEAGRYTTDKAEAYIREPELGTTAMLASEAPEFSPACWDETKIRVLKDRISAAENDRAAAVSDLDEARHELDYIRECSGNQMRMLDDIAGKLGLAHDEGIDDAGPFLKAIDVLLARAQFFEKALDRISRPLWHMQDQLPPGYQLDGIVAQSLITPDYLQDIARSALSEAPPQGEQ